MCVIRDLRMRDGAEVTLTLESTGCVGDVNEVNYLEHVQLTVDLTYTRRGDLQIFLTSPSGIALTIVENMPYNNYLQ
jgi:subtilisin-like proprotein convertase family protein